MRIYTERGNKRLSLLLAAVTAGCLVGIMLYGIACRGGSREEGTGKGMGEGGKGESAVEDSRGGVFKGSVFYLRHSKSHLGLSELRRYDFATNKHSTLGKIEGMLISQAFISRDGGNFIFEGAGRNQKKVIGITPITEGKLEWDQTETFVTGNEVLGINYDDWRDTVYFCTLKPGYIKGAGLFSYASRRRCIRLNSKPYSIKSINETLTTDFTAISEGNFYGTRYIDGAVWLVKSPKTTGAEEKLFRRPYYTERVIVLDGEKYCVFSRSYCDMVAGKSKQWLSVASLTRDNSEGGPNFKDYNVPFEYGVSVVQPPPSLGLRGVLLETYDPTSKRGGVFYREIAFFDLEKVEIIPLFECPKGFIGDIPQVIAWLDSPSAGEEAVLKGAVNNR